MKKTRLICMLLVLAFLLISCNSKVTYEPSHIDDMHIFQDENGEESNLTDEQLARKLGIQFANGNFAELYPNLSDDLKTEVDVTSLKNSWQDYVSSIGYFVGFYGTKSIAIEDYTAIKVFLIYEESDLALSLKFVDGKIDGLWLNYFNIPIAENTPAFSEEVVEINYDGLPLDGMLTLPKGVDQPPVVLLVSDIGRYNYNASRGTAKNSIMRDIAHGLARQGIASLRVNKRFYQYQELYNNESTLNEDTLFDVSAAVGYLADESRIDNSRIYVLGHGFSGSLTPKIALDNPEVCGIISLGGSPRHLADVYYEQSIHIAQNNPNLTDTQREKNRETQKEKVAAIKAGEIDETTIVFSSYAAFWQGVNHIDNEFILNYLDLPILVLHAGEDIEFGDIEYESWQKVLEFKENASLKNYPGLNHLFMTSNGKVDISEYNIAANVDKTVIDDIAKWILKDK